MLVSGLIDVELRCGEFLQRADKTLKLNLVQ